MLRLPLEALRRKGVFLENKVKAWDLIQAEHSAGGRVVERAEGWWKLCLWLQFHLFFDP